MTAEAAKVKRTVPGYKEEYIYSKLPREISKMT